MTLVSNSLSLSYTPNYINIKYKIKKYKAKMDEEIQKIEELEEELKQLK